MESDPVIFWFRQDLRLKDNPALHAAARLGPVLPVYILDDARAGPWRPGSASRVWLHHSLTALDQTLGGHLSVHAGDPGPILERLIKRHQAKAVYWNRCYEPWRSARDRELEDKLKGDGIAVHTDNGSLLWEPWETLKNDGTPYQVFTPYYQRGCMQAQPPRMPLPAPRNLRLVRDAARRSTLADLDLLPAHNWHRALMRHWQPGEAGAGKQLRAFLKHGLAAYREGRDYPSRPAVSRLSPHLHFGEISPNQAWHAVYARAHDANRDRFLCELGWREFSHSLLEHFPELPERDLRDTFAGLRWRDDPQALRRWQQGRTGYPLVDAGMRELWQTGYMHNRIRMVVGSFLVKNLLLDWRHGERWFWDCLVDADLANNSASWQWVAGCGADAAPYFRVFNPVTQGHKFDPEGEYTRRFVPELNHLPVKYLFSPGTAPPEVLARAGVVLGETYPRPIVDLQASRARFLHAVRQ